MSYSVCTASCYPCGEFGDKYTLGIVGLPELTKYSTCYPGI